MSAVLIGFVACQSTSPLGEESDDDSSGATGGFAGSGANGARGGQSAQGGEGGAVAGDSGTGGSSAMGGAAGKPNVDPDCQCTTANHDFSCTKSTVTISKGFTDPASCSLLDTRVKRERCSNGFRYTFVEGEENDYVLEVDSTGKATYFQASGYVSSGCGLDSQDYGYGKTTMGGRTLVGCHEACALCDAYEDLPACSTCGAAGAAGADGAAGAGGGSVCP